MIKLRIDVDYPYPSRMKSFLCTTIGIKNSKNYLTNSKILARMINESPEQVKSTWFFTPNTIPDNELLKLLNVERHEVALHIANNPLKEKELLERATGRKLTYYTTHGTARLLARIMWKRWKAKTPQIPSDFPLESFYQFPTVPLDRLCYANDLTTTLEATRDGIAKGSVIHIHPEWLFQRGTINYRGPYYETLKRVLQVDQDLERLTLSKRIFFVQARDIWEYDRDTCPTEETTRKLKERGTDILTFVERRWISEIPNPNPAWIAEEDNVGLLQVMSYEKWLKDIVKKTRHNMVRKAERLGVGTKIVSTADDKLVEDIRRIYNETPIRQNRAFPHYGIRAEALKGMLLLTNCTLVTAHINEELVGFAQLRHGEDTAILFQLLSLQKHWDKAVNNALVARAVKICEEKGTRWIVYGRMETAHPSLDSFKRHNGFTRFPVRRYYVPLTGKGKIAIMLKLHRDLKDTLPKRIKYPLIPLYSWISRTKIRFRLKLERRQRT